MRKPSHTTGPTIRRRSSVVPPSGITQQEVDDFNQLMSHRPLISRKPTKDPQDLNEPVGAYLGKNKDDDKLMNSTKPSAQLNIKDEEVTLTPNEEAILQQTQEILTRKRFGKKIQRRFQDVKFKASSTAFDRHGTSQDRGSFHGFFALFWLALAFLAVKTTMEHWRETGHFFKGQLFFLYSVDIWDLAAVDAIMVCSSAFVYLLQLAVHHAGLSWNRYGYLIEHIWQTAYLSAVVSRSYTANWGWIQSVVISLHCVVMLMKQYSYATYMGYLSEIYKTKLRLERKLTHLRSQSSSVPKLRVRRPSGDAIADDDSSDTTLNEESEEETLLLEIDELADELTHDGVTYPENLTLRNYIDYLLVPSLVYDIVYPRTERIRWHFVFEKTLATLGTFLLMTMIVEHYILPVIPENLALMSPQQKFAELPWLMLDMVFPFITMYLLTFYIIFECVCQWFAEITRFADRNFYNDWWNSLTWDDFARDWNVPVHRFLLRHVYHSSMSVLNVKKQNATLITFFLSSLVHEMVMACMTKKIRAYLLISQMLQLPLVVVMRTRYFKRNPVLANIFFWFGIFVGPSFICLSYVLF